MKFITRFIYFTVLVYCCSSTASAERKGNGPYNPNQNKVNKCQGLFKNSNSKSTGSSQQPQLEKALGRLQTTYNPMSVSRREDAESYVEELLRIFGEEGESFSRQLLQEEVKKAQQRAEVDLDNQFLDEKLNELSGEDLKNVDQQFKILAKHVRKFDPNRRGINRLRSGGLVGTVARFTDRLPVVGDRVASYVTDFMSARELIKAVVNSLKDTTLDHYKSIERLEIEVAKALAKKESLTAELEKVEEILAVLKHKLNESDISDSEVSFLKANVVLKFEQLRMDLWQNLGIANSAIILHTTQVEQLELEINNVNRVATMTENVLPLAVTTAMVNAKMVNSQKFRKAAADSIAETLESSAELSKKTGEAAAASLSESVLPIDSVIHFQKTVVEAASTIARAKLEAADLVSEQADRIAELTESSQQQIDQLLSQPSYLRLLDKVEHGKSLIEESEAPEADSARLGLN